jgi:3-hydroxyacyl-[acyl-carrier-protein] dehydratase
MTTLYTILNLTTAGNTFHVSIAFNPSHPVFEGHFPGKPIVPGVVLVEISAAVASLVAGKELSVKEASVIKFLRVIEPLVNPVIKMIGVILEDKNGSFRADLSFTSGDVIYAKLKGITLTEH